MEIKATFSQGSGAEVDGVALLSETESSEKKKRCTHKIHKYKSKKKIIQLGGHSEGAQGEERQRRRVLGSQ